MSSTAAEDAQGSLLKIGDAASPEVFAAIENTHRVQAPDINFDLIDISSHDSVGGFREFLPGLAAGNNAQGEAFYHGDGPAQILLRNANLNKTLKNFKLVLNGAGVGDTLDFAGYCMSFQVQANIGDAKRLSYGIRMTAQPTWS